MEEATNGVTEYDYDIFDNLTYVKDPMGNETNIVYDDLGRKTSMDDPYMGHWEYDYDENGNLVWQKDAEDRVVEMEYDELNRMEWKNYIDDSRLVTYTYDEEIVPYYNIGSLTTVVSPEGETKYNYDEMGRQVKEVRTIDSVDYVVEREYDLAGRLDYITYPADGPEIDYSYHPIGSLSQVDKVGSGSTMIAQYNMEDYNALGQVEYVRYGNGTGTQYEYYVGNFRLENMKTTLDTSGDIQDLSYVYDNVGNITGITDTKNSVNHTFVYDDVNRLTTATATGGSDPSRLYNQGYTYDLAGNMTSKTGAGGWEVLDHDSRYRPTAVAYDEEVAGVGERVVDYNQDHKPTHITYNGGTTTELTYDGERNRIKKVQGSETVIYVGEIYEKRNGQALSYIFANGKKIVTLTDNNHEYYTHSDHLGSTTIVTDENGTAVEEIGYLPFGATLFRYEYNGSTWESAYKFTGQEFDPEYHLYNYNARLYDVIMSRFITPDIIVPEPYNPQSLNRYSYCINNPLIYTDPSGYSSKNPCEDGECEEFTLEEQTVTEKRMNPDAYSILDSFSQWWIVYPWDTWAWPANYMTVSDAGRQMIKYNEAVGGIPNLTVYDDGFGNLTIGYGHKIRKGEDFSKGITKKKAEELFESDLKEKERIANQLIVAPLSQNQFDAIVDLLFNVKLTEFASSKCLEYINSRDYGPAMRELAEFRMSGGIIVQDLVLRRQREIILFMFNIYEPHP